jgi:fibronectin type 3 domain-containing protein
MKKLIFVLLLFTAPTFAQVVPTPATTTVQLAWTETTPGATFNVYRWYKGLLPAQAGPNGFQKMNAAPITALTYNDTTAAVGTMYTYEVTAVNASGESAPSTQVDITVSAPVIVPAVPTNLKVTVVITN